MPKPNSRRVALLAAVCGTALMFPLIGMADSAPTPPAQGQAPAPSPDKAPADDAGAQRRADRQAYFASHLAALHAGLQLKQEQESLWPPVEEALQGLAKTHGHHWHHGGSAESAPPLQTLGEHLVARGQAITKLADAAGPLVASLTPQQKGRLPILLRGLRPARLLDRAFAVEADRDDGSEDRWEHHHHRFFDEDRGGNDERGFDHREHRGDAQDEHDWHGEYADRDGFGDRDGHSGADYDWRPRHHHHEDDDNDAT